MLMSHCYLQDLLELQVALDLMDFLDHADLLVLPERRAPLVAQAFLDHVASGESRASLVCQEGTDLQDPQVILVTF